MRPVYLLKPAPEDRKNPALQGLPYALRVRIRGKSEEAGTAWIETLGGGLIGKVSLNSLERLK